MCCFQVADVSSQAALNKGEKYFISICAKFASQIALPLLCGSVHICMTTFRVQRLEADSEMEDISYYCKEIQE